MLGAALPQSLARTKSVRWAGITGFAAGLLADLDILIQSESDPLLALQFHRHFTHSLIFIPLGGLIAALLIWLITRRRASFLPTWGFATLGYATHGLLDACTSYGTQLLWPFSDARIAWSNIAIVDPVFTVPLLLAVIVSAWSRKPVFARLGLTFSLIYLLFGVFQRERASDFLQEVLDQRGHNHVTRAEVKPTIGNLVLWRALYERDGIFHVDAVRVGWFSDPILYEGGSVERFRPEVSHPELAEDSTLARDIRRFAWFSDDWLAVHPSRPNSVGDFRYALLPNDVTPLWGIGIDPTRPNEHVPYETYRSVNSELWDRYLQMVKGVPPEAIGEHQAN